MRLLDLFCGAGGAAMGYHQAGFSEIVGIDITPQKNYPFTFVQADALTPPVDLHDFDLIHASPPCQENVALSVNRHGKASARWPDMIPQTRTMLSGYTSVIENVVGSSLRVDLRLRGQMFGLSTSRVRLFELSGWFAMSPPQPRRQVDAVAIYGKPDGRRLWTRKDGTELRAWSSLEEGQMVLGVPWMTDQFEIREAIPPAYTRYIGEQFLETRT